MNIRIRGTTREVDQRAKELRWNMTAAEQVLWEQLRSKQLDGFKFRAQHPVGRFVLDFCCPSRKLVVELDGGVHEEQQERDQERTQVLEAYGYRVIRFENREVLESTEVVMDKIRDALTATGSQAPLAGEAPLTREAPLTPQVWGVPEGKILSPPEVGGPGGPAPEGEDPSPPKIGGPGGPAPEGENPSPPKIGGPGGPDTSEKE